MSMIDQKGSCYCGAVEFSCKGSIMFNGMCHCKLCSRIAGCSPVHLIGVTPKATAFEVTKGADKLKTFTSTNGKFSHDMCTDCGTRLCQGPTGADFRAIFPVGFHIEQGDKGCMLPEELRPKAHMNYENRLFDHHCDLPKHKAFGDPMMDNSGNILG